MDIVKGMVVKSSAGRDKGGFFVITEVDGNYVQICDGKTRPLERTKRKKVKHLKPTKMSLEESSMLTNREIRRSLNTLKKAD